MPVTSRGSRAAAALAATLCSCGSVEPAPQPPGPATGRPTPTLDIECAIVPSSCTCSYECQRVWNGLPSATCASACPNLDDPATREPPPKRRCGARGGACAFLD